MIRSIDPAADIDAVPRVSAAQIIAMAGAQEPARLRGTRTRRGALLAPLAAVVVVGRCRNRRAGSSWPFGRYRAARRHGATAAVSDHFFAAAGSPAARLRR